MQYMCNAGKPINHFSLPSFLFYTAHTPQHRQELLSDFQTKQLSTPESLVLRAVKHLLFQKQQWSLYKIESAVPDLSSFFVTAQRQMSCIRESLLSVVPQTHGGLHKEMFPNKTVCHYLQTSDNAIVDFHELQ